MATTSTKKGAAQTAKNGAHAAAQKDGVAKKAAATSKNAKATGTPGSPEVIEALQTQVANGFTMYINYKHYHWESFGPHFRDLHLMFDDFANAVRETIDELAERVRILGASPIYAPPEVAAKASIAIAAASGTMQDMLREAHANEVTVIETMHDGIETADDADDPGTADLLTVYIQIHEKQEWFLRQAHSRGDELE